MSYIIVSFVGFLKRVFSSFWMPLDVILSFLDLNCELNHSKKIIFQFLRTFQWSLKEVISKYFVLDFQNKGKCFFLKNICIYLLIIRDISMSVWIL